MEEKMRLDLLMVQNGLISSREKAKELIRSSGVLVNGKRQKKPGLLVYTDSQIVLLADPLQYVSRGGLKLEKMVTKHSLDFSGMVCIDIGASSGGFTDCMLQNGARKVYAVDVGHGQLAETLCKDRRVVNLERTNIRTVTEKEISEPVDFGSVDVSFISLTLVLPVLFWLLSENGTAVCLVKPQFEAGKGKIGKKGVVKEPKTHLEVLERIYDFCLSMGFCVLDADYSPIKGPEGNIEYLLYLAKGKQDKIYKKSALKELVKQSHMNV